MSWVNDIVQARPDLPHVDDGVYDSLKLYDSSESYDEYILRCVCTGIEQLFTRAEFEARSRMPYSGRHFFEAVIGV